MSIKKTNLTPDVKSRLRQAVLGAIDEKKPPAPVVNKPINKNLSSMSAPNINHPQLKTLKKINLEPLATSSMPSKKLSPTVKKSAPTTPKTVAKAKATNKEITKKPKVTKAVLVKPVQALSTPKKTVRSVLTVKTPTEKKPTTPVIANSKRFSLYKKSASVNDWQKPVKEESLESIFSAPTAPTFKTAPAKKLKSGLGLRRDGGAKIIIKLLAVVLGVLLLVLLFDIFGVYRLGFRDVVSSQVAKVLFLPAGQVNGNFLSLGEYLSDLNSLGASIVQNREGLIDYSGSSDIKNKIFYRLSANLLMENKLKTYNVAVSQKDVSAQMDLLFQQTGGRKEAEAVVKNIYSLGLDDFSNKILRPMIVREALQKAIIGDNNLEITKTSKTKADEVLTLALATSSDFEALAKQYTDDESGVNTGGDLGWVVKGQLDPRWDSLIFGSSSNIVIPQIIVSNYGFHIVKIEQRLTDKDTGAESVKLRHILIKVDVDKYIKSLLDSAKLVKYVN